MTNLFDTPDFDGDTYEAPLDKPRLSTQLKQVFDLMKDGQWRTLSEIGAKGSGSGVSARLRDLRKAKFGGHKVERRRKGNPKDGLFEYRLIVNDLPQGEKANNAKGAI